MSNPLDFEQAWLSKLSRCLQRVSGKEVQRQVMEGSESLTMASSRQEVIRWSQQAMERLDTLVDEEARQQIMAGCACQYPKAELEEARKTWENTGDLDRVHGLLQAQFETFLRQVLALDETLIQEIASRGWGLAGVRQGDTIIATKIPKSSFLVEYMQEPDPDVRRQYYCHCPRVREIVLGQGGLSPTYCYCGAGYYQGIWEEILQQPVKVELLESVLQGDEVCKVAIHIGQKI